jgi:nucleoside-diphosphate-sugar epimerase
VTLDVSLYGKICVVTGASGFIGGHLCDQLRTIGAIVHEVRRHTVDLLHTPTVGAYLLQTTPDYVFHLAAHGIAHADADNSDIISDNVQMVSSLITGLSALPRQNCRLMVAGSMSEYGAIGSPFRETSPCAPTTAYGIAKLASSLFALAYGRQAGVRPTVARIFGAYGPGESPSRLFPSLLGSLREMSPVELSDGHQVRDFIHVDDVCNGLIRMAVAESAQNQILNLGTGAGVSIRSVCIGLARELGAPKELLRFGFRKRSPGDADHLVADTSRLSMVLGWVPPQRLAQEHLLHLWQGR